MAWPLIRSPTPESGARGSWLLAAARPRTQGRSGQSLMPDRCSPLADSLVTEELAAEINEIERSVRFLVQKLPTHEDFLRRYCPAP